MPLVTDFTDHKTLNPHCPVAPSLLEKLDELMSRWKKKNFTGNELVVQEAFWTWSGVTSGSSRMCWNSVKNGRRDC